MARLLELSKYIIPFLHQWIVLSHDSRSPTAVGGYCGLELILQFAHSMASPQPTIAMSSTIMTVPRPAPRRAQRKPKAKLPPAVAHEMDVIRAARMGIDISYMAPEERCKYPSKFCCNMRARKSTGKLHRFCEYHRSRANDNQKRWTNIRRSHEHNQEMVSNALALCADDSEWTDISMPLIAAALGHALPITPLMISPLQKQDEHAQKLPMSPTNVEALPDEEIPLTEDDIDMLTSIVVASENAAASEYLPLEDSALMYLLNDMESPVVTPTVFDRVMIESL